MKTFKQFIYEDASEHVDIFKEQLIDNAKRNEPLFVKLSHINQLQIKFNFMTHPLTDDQNNNETHNQSVQLFYIYNKNILFMYNKPYNRFWITLNIWDKLGDEIGVRYRKDVLSIIIGKLFNKKDVQVFDFVTKFLKLYKKLF